VIFQDFPGPGIFKKKVQDFPEGVGTLFYARQRVIRNSITNPACWKGLGVSLSLSELKTAVSCAMNEWRKYAS